MSILTGCLLKNGIRYKLYYFYQVLKKMAVTVIPLQVPSTQKTHLCLYQNFHNILNVKQIPIFLWHIEWLKMGVLFKFLLIPPTQIEIFNAIKMSSMMAKNISVFPNFLVVIDPTNVNISSLVIIYPFPYPTESCSNMYYII